MSVNLQNILSNSGYPSNFVFRIPNWLSYSETNFGRDNWAYKSLKVETW